MQFVFSSRYLWIYTATYLHMVYLRWLQAELQSNSRFTSRLQLSELRDVLGGCDWLRLEMHSEAVMQWVSRCIWRTSLCKHAGCDGMGLELHMQCHDCANLKAIMEGIERYTWWPQLSELRDGHQSCDWANLTMHLENRAKWEEN